MKFRKLVPFIAAAMVAMPLAACSPQQSTSADGTTTVNWWTWDEKQAASYKECLPGFEAANPGVKVNISQYAVDDYFTKITAGFVAGTAPDAFQNSVQFFDAYQRQGQLEPLDDYIKKDNYDLGQFNVGVDAWKYTDGKQYGLPLDWAAAAIYYNKDLVKKAGLKDSDIENLSWNPTDGGSYDKVVSHLTVDKKGVRGDEPGFDKAHVATYGTGLMGTNDFGGQTTWDAFISPTGWTRNDKPSWPTKFNYNDPTFIKTMDYMRSLSDRGFAPKPGEFTIGDTEQLSSGKVALTSGGSWSASTFAKLPGVSVGIAPTVKGADGKRLGMSNSNGNQIYAGSKNKDSAWKWISYMGTEACQTAAATTSGSFFPSIPGAMEAFAASQKKAGIDLHVFVDAAKNKEIYPAGPYANGSELGTTLQPMFEAFFSHERDNDIFADMAAKSQEILAK